MSHQREALTAAVVAVAAVVTLVGLARVSDAIPAEELRLRVDDASFNVPSGALTTRTDPDQDEWAIASLIVLTSDANGLPSSAETWLEDDGDQYELGSRTPRDDGVTLGGRVPSTFDQSSAVLRIAFEGGPTVSLSLDGYEVGIDDGARE